MRKPVSTFAVHAILAAYTALALFPIILVIMNSFKAKRAIFNTPLTPPMPWNFDPIGYFKVFGDSAMRDYEPHVTKVEVVNNLESLHRVVDGLLL